MTLVNERATRAIRGRITNRLRFDTLAKCGFRCHYCGVSAAVETLVVDHVLPVTLGGQTMPENLVAACQPCNEGKSSKTIEAPPVPPCLGLVAANVGRKLRYPEKREASFEEGTLARVQRVLADSETQVGFIRDAVIRELERREKDKDQ